MNLIVWYNTYTYIHTYVYVCIDTYIYKDLIKTKLRTRKLAQRLRALANLEEDIGLVPSTAMAAYSHL